MEVFLTEDFDRGFDVFLVSLTSFSNYSSLKVKNNLIVLIIRLLISVFASNIIILAGVRKSI